MNQAPLDHQRCTIYTYFEQNLTAAKALKKDPKKQSVVLNELEGELQILGTWARAMWAIGLNPVILGPDDANRHPSYTEFSKSNVVNAETKKKNAKFFAWLSRGGGILSDYRVIPATRNQADEALQLLRSCQFKEPLAFDDESLSLIVANIKDLKPFVFDLMRGRTESDLLINFEVLNQDTFAYYSNRNFRAVTNDLKGGVHADKDAVNDRPVPAAKINGMMKTHLKQVFLDSFPAGISVSSPSQFPLSETIAKSLAECPKTSAFVNYCLPVRSTLHYLAKSQKSSSSAFTFVKACRQLPCSRSARTKTRKSHSRLSVGFANPLSAQKSFTVATLPHPWTLLSSEHPEGAELTAEMVQDHYPRDPLVSQLSKSILRSEPGSTSTNLTLVALKDSVFQHTFDSNVTWLMLENKQRQVSTLEWDIGFPISDKDDFLTSASRSFVALNFEEINKRIDNDLVGVDYQYKSNVTHTTDAVLDAVKEFNKADYEIWRFLEKWSRNKARNLQFIQDQLNSFSRSLDV